MNLYKKYINYKINKLEKYAINIVKDLKMEKFPVILYGKEAKNFIRDNSDSKGNVNGAFMHENLDEKYSETGVVCLVKFRLSTLAHELTHAKQYQDKNNWLKKDELKKEYYKYRYPFYPSEVEAFKYATLYLIKEKKYLSVFIYRLEYILLKLEYKFVRFNYINKWDQIKHNFE